MGDLTPVLGIICGMKAEARALGTWAEDSRIRVAVSGARPGRAEAAARRLVKQGCQALLSWGLAGGLDPALRPGDLVTATEVRREDATALAAMPVPDCARALPSLGVDRIIATPTEKAALHSQGLGFVDMESHSAALVAAEAGRPFYVLRAIADPADRALPPLAANALGPDGSPRLGAVLAGLARRPWDLSALWRLKRDSERGLATLAAVAKTALPAVLATLNPSSSRA